MKKITPISPELQQKLIQYAHRLNASAFSLDPNNNEEFSLSIVRDYYQSKMHMDRKDQMLIIVNQEGKALNYISKGTLSQEYEIKIANYLAKKLIEEYTSVSSLKELTMQGFAIIKVYPDKTKLPVLFPPKELTLEQNDFLQSFAIEVNRNIGNETLELNAKNTYKKPNSSSDLQTSLKK